MTQTHAFGLALKACGITSLVGSMPQVAEAMAARLTQLAQSPEPPIAWQWSSVPAAAHWTVWVGVALGVLLLWFGERLARRVFRPHASRCESCERELPIIGEHDCSAGVDRPGPPLSERGFLRYAVPLVGIGAIVPGLTYAPFMLIYLATNMSDGVPITAEEVYATTLAISTVFIGMIGLGACILFGRERIVRALVPEKSRGCLNDRE